MFGESAIEPNHHLREFLPKGIEVEEFNPAGVGGRLRIIAACENLFNLRLRYRGPIAR